MHTISHSYQRILDTSQQGIWSMNADCVTTLVNKRMAAMLGYTCRAMIGKPVTDFLFAQDIGEHWGEVGRRERGLPSVYERRLRHRTGKTVWCTVTVTALRDEDGRFEGSFGMLMDITRHKKTEDALRESGDKFRTLFEHMAQGAFYQRADGMLQEVNNAALEMFGYTRRQLAVRMRSGFPYKMIDETGRVLAVPEYPSRVAFKTGKPFRSVVGVYNPRRKQYVWMNVNAIPQFRMGEKEPFQVFVTMHDISDLRRTEQALRESDARWQYALEGAGEGVWDYDALSGTLFHSKQWKTTLGYAEDEIGDSSEAWLGLIHPDDRQRTLERVRRCFSGETEVYVSEHRLLCKDGSYKWILSRGKVISRAPDGSITRAVGTHAELTEQKAVERALLDSRQRFQSLFDNMNEGVAFHEFVYDKNGKPVNYRLTGVNSAFERILGIAGSDAVGKLATEVYGTKEPPFLGEFISASTKGSGSIDVYFAPLNKHFSVSVVSFQPDTFVTIFFDITTRKLADEQIRKSLEEKEVLLREISHRVKNNLQTITSLFNLQIAASPDKESVRVLRESQARVRSISLVHERLYKSVDLRSIDMRGYLNDLVMSIAVSFCLDLSRVRFVCDIAEGLCLEMDKANTIGLIVTELVTNACKYAFPAGASGSIRIELKARTPGLMLEVSDTGVGFPPGFDPASGKTLGVQLVRALVANGKVAFFNRNGAVVKIDSEENDTCC